MTLAAYEETAEPKATYADVVGEALAGEPDAVMLIGYPGEASVMINDWQASGKARNVAWYFGDGVQDASFVDNVANRGVLEGRRGTAPYSDPAFTSAFEQKYGKKPPFDATASFDAVMLMALALVAIFTGGLPTYKKGWIALRNGNLNMNSLMSIAVTGAMVIGYWPEAATVMFLFALAEVIEAKSLDRARRACEAAPGCARLSCSSW